VLLIETGLATLAILIALVRPTLGSHLFERIEHCFSRPAKHCTLAIALIGFSTLVLRIAVLPVEPIPEPAVHDEFAYLLQADTFAHGRLTNPTPHMWQHFETFHVIFQPTYCSKFFPGQGLFLALGKVVFGHPFWGVWLTSGLMCATITWMLQGWFPPEWAFLGGALALLRFGVFGYWANSYWGGNVAAIGGALVLGALPRIKSAILWQDATLMGIGLALLANSRPWEGVVLSLPVAVMLLVWMFGNNGPSLKVSLRTVGLPLVVVLGLTCGWLAYYCWRTTGSPVRTPYQVYEHTYGAVPVMVWQHLKPEPVYNNPMMRKLEIDQDLAEYRIPRILHITGSLFAVALFFFGPILLLPFGVLGFALPYGFSFHDISSSTRALVLIFVVFVVGSELAIFYNPHYSAPATGVILGLILAALRRIRIWNKSGLFLVRAIAVACVIAFGLRIVAIPLHVSKSRYTTYYFDQFFDLHPKGWFARADVRSKLEKIPGGHLLIVQYQPEHDVGSEWVYNDADIDHARIIWARDIGAKRDRELLQVYKDRQAWLLEADEIPPRLLRYGTQGGDTGSDIARLPARSK
jgi:hypothetical protein